LKQSGAVQETPLQPVKAPASGPIEGERHRTPIPERAPSPDKDLSELLEAVREAAGATDRVESGETPPMEEPGDRPSKPPAKKKQWPPPPPSQEDIDE
jgi:hypothetical protein